MARSSWPSVSPLNSKGHPLRLPRLYVAAVHEQVNTNPMAGLDVSRGAVGDVLPNWGHSGSCSGGLLYPKDVGRETSKMVDTVFYFHQDIQSAGP